MLNRSEASSPLRVKGNNWLNTPQQWLLEITTGRVHYDGLGELTPLWLLLRHIDDLMHSLNNHPWSLGWNVVVAALGNDLDAVG